MVCVSNQPKFCFEQAFAEISHFTRCFILTSALSGACNAGSCRWHAVTWWSVASGWCWTWWWWCWGQSKMYSDHFLLFSCLLSGCKLFSKPRAVLTDTSNELFITNSVRSDDDGEMHFFTCCISADKVFTAATISLWNWCLSCTSADKVFTDSSVYFWLCSILCRSFIMSFSSFGAAVGNTSLGSCKTISSVCDALLFLPFWCWWICCWTRSCSSADSFSRWHGARCGSLTSVEKSPETS